MDALKEVLDRLPVTTILTVLVAIVGGVIAVTNPDQLSFLEYAGAVGVSGGGLGVLGIARTQAGKG
jgi:hypothetical protein